jgi:Kef-type K+ transport system membrane component KefB
MFTTIAQYLQIGPWTAGPNAVFWAALILIGAALLGEAGNRRFGLPRIVGYSAAGMVIALAGRGVTEGRLDGVLGLIVDLALALLLFEIGSRMRLRWLRSNPALLWTSAAESLLSFAAIAATLHALGVELNLALACATLTVSASGAVLGRVATELGAAGQVTERMLLLTALNTLYAVLANRLVIGWIHLDVAGDWVQGITQPLYTFAGSALIAALLGRGVATVMRKLDLSDENSVLLLLGLIALAVTSARLLNLSTLLVPLIAGAILRNTTDRPWVWPRHFGTAGGVMVLMLFVIVGSAWSVQNVAAGIVLAAALLAARAVAKGIAIVGLAHWSGIEVKQGLALALTMTPISGTTLALYADLHRTHPDFATRLAPIILTAIALMELIGPIVVQRALRMAGEEHPVPRPRRETLP